MRILDRLQDNCTKNCRYNHFIPNILVVDDDEAILNSVGKMLKNLGHDVKIAHDGQEARELMGELRGFDCVITDINMPGMDGNEVADRI